MSSKKSITFSKFISAFWTSILLFCASHASATEYLEARIGYLVSGVGEKETGQEAAQLTAVNRCGVFTRNCFGTYTGAKWVNGQWGWTGTETYTLVESGSTTTQPIGGLISTYCPTGWYTESTGTWPVRCWRQEQPLPPCEECDRRKAAQVGNPILVNGGVKIQSEVDYENPSGTLKLVRTYRSDEGTWRHNYQIFGIDFNNAFNINVPPFACFRGRAPGTTSDYCFKYLGRGTAKSFGVRRGAGRLTYFGNDVDYSPPKDVNDRVSQVIDSNGTFVGWSATNTYNDTVELFSPDGRLLSITDRNGLVTTFTYSDASTPGELAPKAGYLTKVTDAFGRSLQFAYTAAGGIAKMFDAEGNVTSYEYDNALNLSKVTYPDGKSKVYIYDEPALTSNQTGAHLLTGIIDENGKRYATFAYDTSRRAISTEHAGGVEKYTLNHFSIGSNVIDPLNTQYRHEYSNILGVLRLTSVSRPSVFNPYIPASSTTEYDANGNIARYKEYDGRVTTYNYDLTRNLETQRIEASGNALARTIQTEWHPTFRLPARVSEPLRRITYIYDAAGNVLTKTVQATTDTNGATGFNATLSGTVQVWTYTYDNFGHVLTAKGPRTGVNATTTFTYDVQGNLATETNAAGHVTTYSNYDQNGRVGRITDPNGLVTDLSYTPRGWLAAVTVGGETTSYDYNGTGQVTQVTLPDGSAIYNTYDDAHRLTGVRDTLGNSITYVLDNMGNRTSEQSKDAAGVLTRQITRAYDWMNRLKQVTGAQQ